MEQIIIMIIFIRLMTAILLRMKNPTRKLLPKLKRKSRPPQGIFDGNYIEVKSFYIQEFGKTPSIAFINGIDTERVLLYIQEGLAGKVLATYQRNFYSWQQKKRKL